MIDAHLHLGCLKEQGAMLSALKGRLFVSSALSAEKGGEELKLCEMGGGYASIGEHPLFAASSTLDTETLSSYLSCPRFKAVGECGLDKKSPLSLKEQLNLLEEHAAFALEHDLPLVLHLTAYRLEAVALLKHYPGLALMVHYASGSYEILSSYLKLGAYLSFCVKSPLSKAALKIIAEMDDKKILVESDYDGKQELKEPCAYAPLQMLANKIAALKGLEPQAMALRLDENLRTFLKLKDDK